MKPPVKYTSHNALPVGRTTTELGGVPLIIVDNFFRFFRQLDQVTLLEEYVSQNIPP
jgi:hypothetical protein